MLGLFRARRGLQGLFGISFVSTPPFGSLSPQRLSCSYSFKLAGFLITCSDFFYQLIKCPASKQSLLAPYSAYFLFPDLSIFTPRFYSDCLLTLYLSVLLPSLSSPSALTFALRELRMEERERPRERVCERDGEESWFQGANGDSAGYLQSGGRKRSFGVESKTFEGRSLKAWSFVQRTVHWEKRWQENGRYFSLVRGENKGGCFLRLGVIDREKKRFSIFVPRGRGAKGGWTLMVEALREMESISGGQVRQKDKDKFWIPMLGKSFAEVVKQNRSTGEEVARVKVDNRALCVNLEKLAHCLVGCWNPMLGGRRGGGGGGGRFKKLGDPNGKIVGAKGQFRLGQTGRRQGIIGI
ncbi:hypothetical protein CK203_029007 [Vitis vinifera]|uniref:Uncharacterized protein n=1 Tax=Vitis vinifera TaxID=29760 RepID=A0A438IMZ6_VITVI|nr:hypothetical protein CK203_029007 [Vitis vinifera]